VPLGPLTPEHRGPCVTCEHGPPTMDSTRAGSLTFLPSPVAFGFASWKSRMAEFAVYKQLLFVGPLPTRRTASHLVLRQESLKRSCGIAGVGSIPAVRASYPILEKR